MRRACGCEADPWVFGHLCRPPFLNWAARRLRAAASGLAGEPVGADAEPGDLHGPELD